MVHSGSVKVLEVLGGRTERRSSTRLRRTGPRSDSMVARNAAATVVFAHYISRFI